MSKHSATIPIWSDVLGDESAELVVFAPTNDAFAATDLGGLDEAGVKSVLEYHVVTNTLIDLSADGAGASESTTLTTAQGGTLELVADGAGGFSVIDSAGNTVPVEATVDTASNGVVFVIGSVLSAGSDTSETPETPEMPESPEMPEAPETPIAPPAGPELPKP